MYLNRIRALIKERLRPVVLPLIPLILLLTPLYSSAAAPEQELWRLAIRQAAVKAEIWNSPSWLKLMYYERSFFGHYKSDSEDPEFFLAKWGNISPRLELEASIDGFFYEGEPDDSPECRFPERYRWLRETLKIPDSMSPPARCRKFEDWKAALDPEAASLVFIAGDLEGPADLFGNTLLRLRKRGADGDGKLDHAVTFAPVREEPPLLRTVTGIFSGKEGKFSVLPYSARLNAYPGVANRDLWEFPLYMTQAELDRLLRHLWELNSASLRWRPVTRNASLQLLQLLDEARPGTDAAPRFHAWVLPLDTVRTALKKTVAALPEWRPALWKTISWKREQLYMGETDSAFELVRGDQAAALTRLAEINPWHEAAVLEVASDYLDWNYYSRRIGDAGLDYIGTPIRAARTSLHRQAVFTGKPDQPASPLETHDSLRVGAGIVSLKKNGQAYEFQGRIAAQDLLDDPGGYMPDSALETGAVRLRYGRRYNRLYVQDARLVHLLSLVPWDDWTRRPSRELSAGVEQAPEAGRQSGRAAVWDMNGGYGLTAEVDGELRQLWYAMAVADSSFGPVLTSNWRAGAGVKAGVLAENGPLRLTCEGRYLGYAFGDTRALWAGTAGASYSIARNSSARAEYSWRGKAREFGLYFHQFFSAP